MENYQPKVMKRFIAITEEQRDLIMKSFKVTSRMINYALSYNKNTDLAKRIRKLALESGGVRMCTLKEIETIHDADGIMTQLLPNGAVIKINRNTGKAIVYMKGDIKISVDNISLREISALHKSAMALK